jgi:hypothetical protein
MKKGISDQGLHRVSKVLKAQQHHQQGEDIEMFLYTALDPIMLSVQNKERLDLDQISDLEDAYSSFVKRIVDIVDAAREFREYSF